MMGITVTLKGQVYEDVGLEWTRYAADGSPALRLWWEDELLCTATVVLADATPAAGCVWIKDWSENEGVLNSLIEAGIVEPTGRVAQAGYVIAQEARVL